MSVHANKGNTKQQAPSTFCGACCVKDTVLGKFGDQFLEPLFAEF